MVLILSTGIWYDIYMKFQIQFQMLQRPGYYLLCMWFYVLIVVNMKIIVICDVIQYGLVGSYSTRLYGVIRKVTVMFVFHMCLIHI
jgi:hypothetical protein